MMNSKLNACSAQIDNRETRSADAKITFGIISFVFKSGSIKMEIGAAYRNINKQKIADIESVIAKYVRVDVDGDMLKRFTSDVLPLAVALDTEI